MGVLTGSAASSFIVDDAIVGLAQPLTEALNQFAGGTRRARDLIEQLGRREDFYFDLAGGSSRRYVDCTAEEAKDARLWKLYDEGPLFGRGTGRRC